MRDFPHIDITDFENEYNGLTQQKAVERLLEVEFLAHELLRSSLVQVVTKHRPISDEEQSLRDYFIKHGFVDLLEVARELCDG